MVVKASPDGISEKVRLAIADHRRALRRFNAAQAASLTDILHNRTVDLEKAKVILNEVRVELVGLIGEEIKQINLQPSYKIERFEVALSDEGGLYLKINKILHQGTIVYSDELQEEYIIRLRDVGKKYCISIVKFPGRD
jgi:hypothetical protein